MYSQFMMHGQKNIKLQCVSVSFLCGTTAHIGPRPPRFEFFISQRHAFPVGLIWASDQLVTEAATFTTHNKHKRRTSMPSAGLEPAIPEKSGGFRLASLTTRPPGAAVCTLVHC